MIWDTLKSPSVEELISLLKILKPVRKWLHGEISTVPRFWNQVGVHGIQNFFKVRRNNDKTLDTFF
jgi:hypothetical protein